MYVIYFLGKSNMIYIILICQERKKEICNTVSAFGEKPGMVGAQRYHLTFLIFIKESSLGLLYFNSIKFCC